MRKIYLDSNVLIDMFDGRRDKLINEILKSLNSDDLCFPFSAAHVSELTAFPKTTRCEDRLDVLETISCKKYFVHSVYDYGFREESPHSVYETLHEALPEVDENSFFANFIPHSKMKEMREQLGLEPSILNNLKGREAVHAIDAALCAVVPDGIEAPRSIKDMLEVVKSITKERFSKTWDDLQTNEKHMTLGDDILGVFSLLESFGYWPDKKNVYVKGSRFADGLHLFAAKHCDVLVTADKGMRNRAEATYLVLGIPTEVISTSEFEEGYF